MRSPALCRPPKAAQGRPHLGCGLAPTDVTDRNQPAELTVHLSALTCPVYFLGAPGRGRQAVHRSGSPGSPAALRPGTFPGGGGVEKDLGCWNQHPPGSAGSFRFRASGGGLGLCISEKRPCSCCPKDPTTEPCTQPSGGHPAAAGVTWPTFSGLAGLRHQFLRTLECAPEVESPRCSSLLSPGGKLRHQEGRTFTPGS